MGNPNNIDCCLDGCCDETTCVKLPDGVTCSDCDHLDRCLALGCTVATNKTCEFFPRRFTNDFTWDSRIKEKEKKKEEDKEMDSIEKRMAKLESFVKVRFGKIEEPDDPIDPAPTLDAYRRGKEDERKRQEREAKELWDRIMAENGSKKIIPSWAVRSSYFSDGGSENRVITRTKDNEICHPGAEMCCVSDFLIVLARAEKAEKTLRMVQGFCESKYDPNATDVLRLIEEEE